jgi:hypothetical protein
MRNTSALQRYKKNFAYILYGKKSNYLTKTECTHIKRIFRHFEPHQHDKIADYPLYLAQNHVFTKADDRKLNDPNNPTRAAYYLFSLQRIQTYLDTLDI